MQNWTYEKAGVPHLKGDPAYNREITQLIRSTRVPGVMGSATGFAALFDFKKAGVKDPLLVSSTDGVGTKLEIARLQGKHDTIGIDLVAMCVNDLITCGGKPIFFLDYFASGKFESAVIRQVLKGVVDGCKQAGCALTGGETAIMPGFYNIEGKQAAQYDIAGFSVGVVDRKKIVSGRTIKPGDAIVGIASSGFHSNGYSLLRKIFSNSELKGPIGRELLTPTRIYVKPVLALLKSMPVKGIVNITGGGFIDNLPRVIPEPYGATLLRDEWTMPKLFRTVQDSGNISDLEMARTFNLGIGMVVVLDKKFAEKAIRLLEKFKMQSWVIGEITKRRSVEVL
jgi:phosphoribosylformylglycinamidine cyclo-ligase